MTSLRNTLILEGYFVYDENGLFQPTEKTHRLNEKAQDLRDQGLPPGTIPNEGEYQGADVSPGSEDGFIATVRDFIFAPPDSDFERSIFNAGAGLGDSATFGLARKIRELLGTDEGIDEDSESYKIGANLDLRNPKRLVADVAEIFQKGLIKLGIKKGLRKKPGSSGKFKGGDALRRHNKMARDAAKNVGLDKKQRRRLHQEISGENLNYQDILKIAKEIADGSF